MAEVVVVEQAVAILLVNYNMAEYLDRCISSIINQTYKDIEIAIVDDGSTDGSGDLIDKYAKK